MLKNKGKKNKEKDLLKTEAEVGGNNKTEQIQEETDWKKLAEENLDKWKRTAADFENYKKRQAENLKDTVRFANWGLILEILPVIDNFHASTEHIPEDQKENPWVVGIMHIQSQLEKVLEDNGVSEILIKEGDNFDPAVMEAISDANDANKNVVKKVLTKGYKMGPARNASHSDAGGDRVLRAARVTVE